MLLRQLSAQTRVFALRMREGPALPGYGYSEIIPFSTHAIQANMDACWPPAAYLIQIIAYEARLRFQVKVFSV